MLESVPNFSEGRDQGTIDALAEALSARARVLDVHADPDHNRSVFTLVGEEDELADSLVAGVECARERIDLRRHDGAHPRIGAADVVPLVPLVPERMERAKAAARTVAQRIGRHAASQAAPAARLQADQRLEDRLSMDLGSFEVDPDVRKNTLAACDVFRSLGATVEEVDLGWDDGVLKAGMAYLEHLFGASLSQLLAEHAGDMTSYARRFAEDGQKSKATDFVATLEVAARMYQLGPLLETYDVLICRRMRFPRCRPNSTRPRTQVEINGKEVNPSLGWVMTTPFNMLSRCPVLSIPWATPPAACRQASRLSAAPIATPMFPGGGLAYETARGQWYGNAGTRPSL